MAKPPHRWWPATLFGLGVVRPPPGRPSGGGRTTPWATGGGSAAPWANHSKENLGVWPKGRPNHPLGHWGWFGHPLGQSLKRKFGHLAQGAAEPPLWPNHPLGHCGWFGHPLGQSLKRKFGCLAQGVAVWGGRTTPRQNGVAGHHL
jgi:hypothetical protein